MMDEIDSVLARLSAVVAPCPLRDDPHFAARLDALAAHDDPGPPQDDRIGARPRVRATPIAAGFDRAVRRALGAG